MDNYNTIVLYHGTSKEATNDIFINGFKTDNPTWVCSDEFVYFHTKFGEEDDGYSGLRNALEAGQIGAAFQMSKENLVSVIRMEIPRELFLELFEHDYSCDGMQDTACRLDVDDFNELLNNHKEYFSVHDYDVYNKYLSPFVLNSVFRNHLFNGCPDNENVMELIKFIQVSRIGSIDDWFNYFTDDELEWLAGVYGDEFSECWFEYEFMDGIQTFLNCYHAAAPWEALAYACDEYIEESDEGEREYYTKALAELM